MLGTKMETLLAVVEYKNFTKAAEALSLTQPAVSHHINQLEEELGAVLFVTDTGRLAGDTECKLAQTVAAFLGKSMES